MRNLIKMILHRIKGNKGFLITYLVLIPITIFIAIVFTNNIKMKANVAVIGRDDIQIESQDIKITTLEKQPKDSDMVLGKYDALITFDENGFEVKTTKGEEIKQALEDTLQGKKVDLKTDNQRGAISNIFGFIMMVILLLGVQMYIFYFEERNGINKRIISTNISSTKYIISHFIVVLSFLFIPAAVMILAAISIFNIVTTVTIVQILMILFVLCLFATSFGIFMNAMSKTLETSFMFGNMFVILTSLISGSFAAVTDNKIFTTISNILPQKQIMDFTIALENGGTNNYIGMIYIVMLSIALILIGIHTEKRLIADR